MSILQNLQERTLRKETSRVIDAIKQQREQECHHNDIGAQCDAECVEGQVLVRIKPTQLQGLLGAVRSYVGVEGFPLEIMPEHNGTVIAWRHIPVDTH